MGADLVFDDQCELVDFVSDDRMAGSADGKTFTSRRWSTPLTSYRDRGQRRLATHGEARWGGPAPDHPFTYLELIVDDIEHNVRRSPPASGPLIGPVGIGARDAEGPTPAHPSTPYGDPT